MKKKFTEGKWSADQTEKGLHTIWADDGTIPVFVARTTFAPASEANSKLICAAPDMYKFIEGIAKGYQPDPSYALSLINRINNP